MKMKEFLKTQLVHDENMKLKIYQCPAGKWTIGVGRNVEDNGITYDEAMFLLDNDIARVEMELHRFTWFPKLNEARQAALMNLNFNLGLTRFLCFSKMIDALAAGHFQKAAIEMLNSKWSDQVGERSHRLAKMIETGEF